MQRIICLIVLLTVPITLFSQNKTGKNPELEIAVKQFERGNYLTALPLFKSELAKEPSNLSIKYRLGICYLHTRINHEEALKNLHECSLEPKADPEVHKYLGRAFMLNYKFDEAIACFLRYSQNLPKQEEEANCLIRQCKNAQALMSLPAVASFQNMGKSVNSSEPDYNPLVNKDETVLVFTSRRKDNVGGNNIEMDGYRNSDIYYSELKNGKWYAARSAGRFLNTPLDEQSVGLSADGTQLFVYIDHIDQFGDLYVSQRNPGTVEFTKMSPIDKNINKYIETSMCQNEEADVIFFSRKENLRSGSDLYICRKLPTGNWAIPQKLPDNINSPYNEESPFLSFDGETLYFSSDGPNSMGGFDLFRSKWDRSANTFSEPENLGYPINSTDDEMSISVTLDNSLAYVSSFRPNGNGDLDIYRVKFNDEDPVSRVYTGQVFFGDTVMKNQPHDVPVSIIASNVMTGAEYNFVPSSKTGRYVMSLSEGLYRIEVYAEGYENFEEEMAISDMGRTKIEYNKNIVLKRKK